MKEYRHLMLFMVIALLLAIVMIGLYSNQSSTHSGVASLGKYGSSDTYQNNVKLEEGTNISIASSDAHNSLILDIGGTFNFLSLPDTPSDYTSYGDNLVRVNIAEDALEFANSITLTDLTVTGIFTASDTVSVGIDLDVLGEIKNTGDAHSGRVYVNDDLEVTGQTYASSLSVSGILTASGTIDMDSSNIVNVNSLDVASVFDIKGEVKNTGAAHSGGVYVDDRLEVTGDIYAAMIRANYFKGRSGTTYMDTQANNGAQIHFRWIATGGGSSDTGATLKQGGFDLTKIIRTIFGTSELTIDADAVAATKSYHTIDTEGDGGEDELLTINGGVAGMTLIIRAEHTDRTVVVEHGTGNLELSSGFDFTMDDTEDTLALIYDGSNWLEVSRSSIDSLPEVNLEGEVHAGGQDISGVAKLSFTASQQTISVGVITITGTYQTVETEGEAGSDELNTINGGNTGQLLIIRAANDAHTVVCKDGVGNLALIGDFSLDDVEDTLTLFFNGSDWLEISRNEIVLSTSTAVLTAAGAVTDSTDTPAQTKVDGTNFDYYVCDFDADADEVISYEFLIPDSYISGEDILPTIYWISEVFTTGDVVWVVQVLGLEDSEAWDSALGAPQSVTTTTDGTAGDINTSTIPPFDPSWVAGDLVIVKIYRDADNGSDTLAGDARYLMTKLSWPSEE